MWLFLRIAYRNALRHRLRSGLTLAGLVIAVVAFGLLRTVVAAWHAGIDAAAADRLVTRNRISLIFPMPYAYLNRVQAVDGVRRVSYMNWFGGEYRDKKNFFPQMAIEHEQFFAIYPEFAIDERALLAFRRDRQAALAGSALAARFGWKVGDTIPIKGGIYPGEWAFHLVGIYDAKPGKVVDRGQFFFRWDYLNEQLKRVAPAYANQIGLFVLRIDDPQQTARVAQSIDSAFRNSAAETLTETEKAFQAGFIAATGDILMLIQVVSYVVILIILAVMANTMAMSARERLAEYATLKALGFAPRVVAVLIMAESVSLAVVGGGLGLLLTVPVVQGMGEALANILPVFPLTTDTLCRQALASIAVGLLAGLLPAWRAARIPVLDGLRSIA